MNNFIHTFLALLFFALTGGSAHGRSLAEIRSTGELRVCVAGSSADFYRENAEEFARYLGAQAKTEVLLNWDAQFAVTEEFAARLDQADATPLASGRCDLYPNDLHITPQRQLRMVLVPYFSTRSVVIARPELRASLRNQRDLRGRTAAVQAGTAYEAWLRTFNSTIKDDPVKINLVDTAQAMREVVERRADFTVIAAESAFKWVRDDLDNLDLLFPIGDVTQVGWGIASNMPDLELALNEFFDQSRRVGSGLDRSWRKKYGVSLMEYQMFTASFDTESRWRELLVKWGIPAGSALAGLLLAMVFWARRLKREVAQHRKVSQALSENQELMREEVSRGKAVSNLLMRLQLVDSLEAFAQVTLQELALHLPLGQGLIAMVSEDNKSLIALAHYAGVSPTPAESLREFPTAAGLMARCAATGELVTVNSPGKDYLRVRSGLGNCEPVSIVMMPIRHAGQVVAVIEMATMHPVSQEHLGLLAALEPIVATGIHRLQKDAETFTKQSLKEVH